MPVGVAGSARRDPLQLLVVDVVDKRSHGDGVLQLQGVGIGVVVDDDGLVQRAAGGRQVLNEHPVAAVVARVAVQAYSSSPAVKTTTSKASAAARRKASTPGRLEMSNSGQKWSKLL